MRERPPRDHADDFIVGVGGDRPGGDVPAVAQNRHRIAEGADLSQAVGDKDDGYALRVHLGDDVTQPIDVASGQR